MEPPKSQRTKLPRFEYEGPEYHLGPKDTIIDGEVYNLTNFTNHPGGETAVSWAYGRDATALFHSYHIWNDKARKLMGKYKKKEQPPGLKAHLGSLQGNDSWKGKKTQLQGWTWDDEFSQELLEMVRDHFKGRSHICSWRKFGVIVVFFALFLVSGWYWFQGVWWSMVAFPCFSWLIGVNTFHDASHRAMSSKGWVNDAYTLAALMFSSPIMWYHQHIIGHHTAPNTRQDPDMRHGARLWRYNPNAPYRWWHKYQLSYFSYLWMWSVFALALLWDYFTIKTGVYRNTIPLKGLNIFPHLLQRSLVVCVFFITPLLVLPLHQAAVWGLSWYLVMGLLFAAISQVNHISVDTLEAFDSSWYKHQTITALNYGFGSSFTYYITGGLNYQIEHHLFPGINHEYLPELAPKVQVICNKYGVKYPYVSNFGKAFRLHLDVLFDCSISPLNSDNCSQKD
jgi:delta11-fatty-acid desaturase